MQILEYGGWQLVVENTPAYYDTWTITGLKSFVVEAPGGGSEPSILDV
jgi:hypothetical protein